ncbi:MAG TPA: hypothetical protein VFA65_23200 [Bryobacteraceae bacterium]|nr:hypothetical protein [Bryobacteraceae bacterium]
MEIAKIERLSQNVANSIAELRKVFHSSLPVPEILDRFWRLQDNLSQLVEAAADHPAETGEVLEQHPHLFTDVVDILDSSAKLQSIHTIAAVRGARESINSSLVEIQHLRQSRTLAASA